MTSKKTAVEPSDFVTQLKLDTLLKEAEIFQSEMDKRLERHAQAFNFCTVILAGALALMDKLGDSGISWAVLVFLPFLTTPLAAMFFDDELLRGVNDFHFHEHVVPEIRKLVKESSSFMRCTLTSRLAYIGELKNRGIIRHYWSGLAATMRRTIFVIPFLLAFVSLFSLSRTHALPRYTEPAFLILLAGAVDVVLLVVTVVMWINAASIWKLVRSHGCPANTKAR